MAGKIDRRDENRPKIGTKMITLNQINSRFRLITFSLEENILILCKEV